MSLECSETLGCPCSASLDASMLDARYPVIAANLEALKGLDDRVN